MSVMWRHVRLKFVGDFEIAECEVCGWSCRKSSGTGVIGRHFANKHPKEYKDILNLRQEAIEARYAAKLSQGAKPKRQPKLKSLVPWERKSRDWQGLTDDITKLIVQENLPYRFVETPGFRLFLKKHFPSYSPPCYNVITSRALAMSEKSPVTTANFVIKEEPVIMAITSGGWRDENDVNICTSTNVVSPPSMDAYPFTNSNEHPTSNGGMDLLSANQPYSGSPSYIAPPQLYSENFLSSSTAGPVATKRKRSDDHDTDRFVGALKVYDGKSQEKPRSSSSLFLQSLAEKLDTLSPQRQIQFQITALTAIGELMEAQEQDMSVRGSL